MCYIIVMITVSTFLLARFPQAARLYLLCRLLDPSGSGWVCADVTEFTGKLRVSGKTLIRWCKHAKEIGLILWFTFIGDKLRIHYRNQAKFIKRYFGFNRLNLIRSSREFAKLSFEAKKDYYSQLRKYQYYRGVVKLPREAVLDIINSNRKTRELGVQGHVEYLTQKAQARLQDSKPAEKQLTREQICGFEATSIFCRQNNHRGLIFKSAHKPAIGVTVRMSLPTVSQVQLASSLELSLSTVKKYLDGVYRYQVHRQFCVAYEKGKSVSKLRKESQQYHQVAKQFEEIEFALDTRHIPGFWRVYSNKLIFERLPCLYVPALCFRVCRNHERTARPGQM